MGAGYEDIHAGTQVIVTDQSGEIISLSKLTVGALVLNGDEPISEQPCSFLFIATVPSGRTAYGIEVAHRGKVFYTEKDLRSSAAVLNLGFPEERSG